MDGCCVETGGGIPLSVATGLGVPVFAIPATARIAALFYGISARLI